MATTRTAAAGVALAGAVALSTAALVQPVSAKDGDHDLKAAKAIAAQFTSETRAINKGYERTEHCVDWREAPEGAAPAGSYMGYHYVKPEILDSVIEARRPEAVLYKEDAHGNRVLTGIEYIVVAEDQVAPYDDSDRPSLWGHDFHGPMPGHVDGMPVHYDLHVWTHDDNPDGAWSAWNTSKDLTCP